MKKYHAAVYCETNRYFAGLVEVVAGAVVEG